MQSQTDMKAQGIDYGNGMTNIDKATGIRYGVISQYEVLQSWADSSEADYGEPTCPHCGNEVKNVCGKYRKYEHARYGCADYVCHACRYVFGSESAFGDSPLAFTYDADGYKASQSGDDTDIFILESPYYTLCAFCSPCAPGAGYIMNSRDNGIRAYCFGHDWFDGGIAPYSVYRVSDGKQVEPAIE